MNLIEALLLGVLQGLTEFLPVSSSGHLEIMNELLGIGGESNLTFTTAVHAGTVLSTIVVFRRQIGELLRGIFKFQMNADMRFFLYLLLSAVPILIVGITCKDAVEQLFGGSLLIVGIMLLLTSALLTVSHFAPKGNKPLTARRALWVGVAQACAVMPGLSRSGSTISVGMMLGLKREKIAAFSFLMAVIPIIGASLLEVVTGDFSGSEELGMMQIIVGFCAAFLTGTLSCKFMVKLVSRGSLLGFALYCLLVGSAVIITSLL